MDKRRFLVAILLSLVLAFVWQRWIAPAFFPHPQLAHTQALQQGVGAVTKTPAAAGQQTPSAVTLSDPKQWIAVKTNVLAIKIDPQGGNIVSVGLLRYPKALHSKQPVMLLSPNPTEQFVSTQGLLSNKAVLPPIQYKANQQQLSLKPGQQKMALVLTGKTADGITSTKTFHFTRDKYVIGVQQQLQNPTNKTWAGNVFVQLSKQNKAASHHFASRGFVGAAFSTTQVPYKQWSYKKLAATPFKEVTQGGWAAFQEKYFLAAVIPDATQKNAYYSMLQNQGLAQLGQSSLYTVGAAMPVISIAPQASVQSHWRYYFGPEEEGTLKHIAPHLDKTVDYGMFWFFAEPIFWLLSGIHTLVGNWGWAIVLVTLVIKLALHPFTAMSFRSMARMRQLAPKMEALKKEHGSDKMKLNQAVMKLYKEEKANPASGCLPMLLQIPIFIALYSVLMVSVELRQAPFIFWIHDLAVHDPYYILPVLMGLSMLLQQRMSPQPADPAQAKMMMLMPIIFTFVFLHFPAGLVVYWLTNNIVTIAQQWWVYRQVEAKSTVITHVPAKKNDKKKKKT